MKLLFSFFFLIQISSFPQRDSVPTGTYESAIGFSITISSVYTDYQKGMVAYGLKLDKTTLYSGHFGLEYKFGYTLRPHYKYTEIEFINTPIQYPINFDYKSYCAYFQFGPRVNILTNPNLYLDGFLGLNLITNTANFGTDGNTTGMLSSGIAIGKEFQLRSNLFLDTNIMYQAYVIKKEGYIDVADLVLSIGIKTSFE